MPSEILFAASETFFTLTVADFESLVVFALAVGGLTALEVLDNFEALLIQV